MLSTALTAEQRKKIHHLENAKWKLEAALERTQFALGGTDMGDEYKTRLLELIEDLETDIEDTYL